MAEIDTRPLESVQSALTHFEQKGDQSRCSPDRNEIDILTKELAGCRLQLKVKENENKQVNLKLGALQKAMQELSDKYDRACLHAHNRITQLEADNSMITRQQSEIAAQCEALKDELVIMKGELDTVKGSNAFVVKEVESMEATMILERENTKEVLMRILQLNEAVLSSSLSAIRAEEERSVFFQEITLEFFKSDKNLEVIKTQMEMIERLENEVLARTVETDYLQSELKHVKELYKSSERVSDATAITDGCANINDQARGTTVKDQEPEAEVAFQRPPEACFVTKISREDYQVVPSDDTNMEGKLSADVVEDGGAEVMVSDSTVLGGNSDAQETCLVNKNPEEDYRTIQSDDKNIDSNKAENKARNLEPEVKTRVVHLKSQQKQEIWNIDSTACKGDSEPADTCCASEISTEAENQEQGELTVAESTTCGGNAGTAETYFDTEISREDDQNISSTMPENVLEGQEEPKADACFVTESSREDFQSVHSDDKNISIAMPENNAGNQEPQGKATPPTSTSCKANSEAAGTCFVAEVVTEICKDDDEFYTKDLGQANKLDEYVLVGKKTDTTDALKDKLDSAHTEISDLRFSLEEAVRRAELAEEAKAALERELREEIQKKRPRRRAQSEDTRAVHDGGTPAPRVPPTPSWKPATPRGSRSAPRGGESERPSLSCVTLGRVLNMKYK